MRRPRVSPLRIAAALAALSLLGAGIAHAAGMSLTSGSLWTGGQQLTKGTCPSPAGSDTTVDESSPNTTGGGQSTVTVVKKNKAANDALIQFDLGTCALPTTAGADSATLTLTVTASFKGPDTIALYPVYSSWSASTLTWNTAQTLTIGTTPTATFSSSLGTKSIDVTADVDAAIKGGSFYGWELVDTSGSGNSSTTISALAGPAGQRPSLAVSYAR